MMADNIVIGTLRMSAALPPVPQQCMAHPECSGKMPEGDPDAGKPRNFYRKIGIACWASDQTPRTSKAAYPQRKRDPFTVTLTTTPQVPFRMQRFLSLMYGTKIGSFKIPSDLSSVVVASFIIGNVNCLAGAGFPLLGTVLSGVTFDIPTASPAQRISITLEGLQARHMFDRVELTVSGPMMRPR